MGGVGSYEVGEAWALSGPVLSRGSGTHFDGKTVVQ